MLGRPATWNCQRKSTNKNPQAESALLAKAAGKGQHMGHSASTRASKGTRQDVPWPTKPQSSSSTSDISQDEAGSPASSPPRWQQAAPYAHTGVPCPPPSLVVGARPSVSPTPLQQHCQGSKRNPSDTRSMSLTRHHCKETKLSPEPRSTTLSQDRHTKPHQPGLQPQTQDLSRIQHLPTHSPKCLG